MIEAIRLTTRRGSGVALRQVSFDVRPGQVTGLIAPDGVSDAVILRLMVQLARGGGRTLFDGERYRRLRNPVREVGVLLDSDAGRVHHAARDHLHLVAATYNLPVRRVDEVLELVGLTDVADRPLRGYNPSMAQRLGIATAIIGDPGALLLRDPCGGLEPRGVAWLHSFARAFAAQGRAVLVTGASPEALCGFTDHVIVVESGEVTADQPTSRYLAASGQPEEPGAVVVGSPHIARLVALLTDAGAHSTHRDETTVSVTGLPRASIGELAFTNGILLHELTEVGARARGTVVERPAAAARPRWTARRGRVVVQGSGRSSAVRGSAVRILRGRSAGLHASTLGESARTDETATSVALLTPVEAGVRVTETVVLDAAEPLTAERPALGAPAGAAQAQPADPRGDTAGAAPAAAVGEARVDAVRDARTNAADDACPNAVGHARTDVLEDVRTGAVGDACTDAVPEMRMGAVRDARTDAVGDARMGAVGGARTRAVGDARMDAAGDTRVDAVGEARTNAVGEARTGAVGEARLGELGVVAGVRVDGWDEHGDGQEGEIR